MRRGRSHRTGAAASKRRRLAFSFAALLAVFLQAFVVQTHVHGLPTAAFSQTFELPADAADGSHEQASAGGNHQSACAICQALAAAGAAALPDAAFLTATNHGGELAKLALALAPLAPAHSWQSRAPPSFL